MEDGEGDAVQRSAHEQIGLRANAVRLRIDTSRDREVLNKATTLENNRYKQALPINPSPVEDTAQPCSLFRNKVTDKFNSLP